MPLPFLLWGAAIVAGSLIGVVRGAQGVSRLRDAKEIGHRAEKGNKEASNRLETKRQQVNSAAEDYGKRLAYSRRDTLGRFVRFVEQLGQRGSQKALEALDKIDISTTHLDEFRGASIEAGHMITGAVKAVSTSVAAGAGTYSLVGLLGTASTGTAIAGLKGAAATNATLAWLGGGSLAAGGGGMAMGTVVLGGIVLAPAVLIAGFVLASEAEKALTKARKYEAEVNREIANMNTMMEFMDRLKTRIAELKDLVTGLDERANEALDRLNPATFDAHNDNDVKVFQQAGLLVKALSEIMRTPILDEESNLTTESGAIAAKYRTLA